MYEEEDEDIYDFPDYYDDEEEIPAICRSDWRKPYVYESRNFWMPIPIPKDQVGNSLTALRSMSDSDLLSVPVSMVCHILRTNASDDIQVISPRTTPLAMTAGRVSDTTRKIDTYIVGSRAVIDAEWPTVDGFVTSEDLPGEPLDANSEPLSNRPATHSRSLLAYNHEIADPVIKAYLKARSLCDLMRRPDVCGDSELLAENLTTAWQTDSDALTTMTSASLAPSGDLLRYAIGVDTVYPCLNAPLHVKQCISVGSFGHAREPYGEHAAIDWRRIRVLCEASFHLSTRSEGIPLTKLALTQPPGDPHAPVGRKGTLTFRPLPGSVWDTNPLTFALNPSKYIPQVTLRANRVGAYIAESLATVMDIARPMMVAAPVRGTITSVPTKRITSVSRTAEGIVTGYVTLLNVMHKGALRGKTAAATVRDIIYEDLTTSARPASVRALWTVETFVVLARQMSIPISRDFRLVHAVASSFSDAASDARQKLVVESERRGMTLDAWWEDICSVLPAEMLRLREGTGSWALAMAWLVLNPPTDKWRKLTPALKYESLADIARTAPHSMRLPAKIGSEERVFAAAKATAQSIARTYSAYYSAVRDACGLMMSSLAVHKGTWEYEALELSRAMWNIRMATVSTMSVSHAVDDKRNILTTTSMRLVLKTSPYAAYTAWHTLLQNCRHVSSEAKAYFPQQVEGPVSTAFGRYTKPLIAGVLRNRVFRYVDEPATLANDLEKTLREAMEDIMQVARGYESETVLVQTAVLVPTVRTINMESAMMRNIDGYDIYDAISTLEYPDTEEYLKYFENLPDETQDILMRVPYKTVDDALRALVSADVGSSHSVDAVR